MNGILLVNKEANMTSNDVLYHIKKAIPVKKIGHAGTLDPLATGLLVVMINEATKLSEYLLSADKEYISEIIVGISTDTEDREGTVLETKPVTELTDVDKVLESMIGVSEQIPPMYSALKVEGKKLYELARKGKTVERKPRQIEVASIKRISDIIYENKVARFSFVCKVSKGTYIRTLCNEIGKRLGYPALMKELKRTRSGVFTLDQAYTLGDIKNQTFTLIPMLDCLKEYPIIETEGEFAKRILNGMAIDEEKIVPKSERIVFSYQQQLIAIYKYQDGKYWAERVWN